MTRLSAIRKRLEAATPKRWRVDRPLAHIKDEAFIFGGEGACVARINVWTDAHDEGVANADLIAHAPQDLRDLLAVADAAKHYNDTGALYPLVDAIEKLDAPVGDEGAVE